MRRAFLATAVLTIATGGCAWVQRASVPDGQRLGDTHGVSNSPSVSDGGRFVTFASNAYDLVANDTNFVMDVFVHDLVTDATERVSVITGGAQVGAPSWDPQISDDGRFVVFLSNASFTAADPDLSTDVYVHDRTTDITTLVSHPVGALPPPLVGDPGAVPASEPAISGDGSTITFNLNDSSLGFAVKFGPYVTIDRAAPTRLNTGGLFPTRASLSDDGSLAAFVTTSPSGGVDAWITGNIVDTADDTVVATPVNLFATHQSQAGASLAISGDGATAAYTLTGQQLGALYSYDVAAETATEVLPQVSSPRLPTLSDDGTRIAYIAVDDGGYRLYVIEPGSGAPPATVSTDPLGRVATGVDQASISGNGEWVTFTSFDSKLVPFDNNAVDDVFVRGIDLRVSGPS